MSLDPEPQPGDGPDYHTDHAFWVERQKKKGNSMRVQMSVLYPFAEGETSSAWSDRALSHSREHEVNRQCTLDWHEECSDPQGESCQCICHAEGAAEYSVEGHAENGELEVTRVEKGKHFWPPVDGEPETMWAWWVWATSKKEAKKQAKAKQTASMSG